MALIVRGIRKTALWVALGAGIGGGIAALWVVLLTGANLLDTPFLADGFIVFGGSGFIVGAVFGLVFGLLIYSSRKTVQVIGGVISGVIGGLGTWILIPFVVLIFASRSWPSPRPYPAASVTTNKTLGASGWHYRTQVYTITLSIDDLQQYYAGQTSRYCKDEWQFKRPSDPEHTHCRAASCNIRPETDIDPQTFYVYICPVGETRTKVIQEDMWDFD